MKIQLFENTNEQRIKANHLTEDQKKEYANLQAAVINAESQGAQATIKFQKEVEKLNDEQQKSIQKFNELAAKAKEAKDREDDKNSIEKGKKEIADKVDLQKTAEDLITSNFRDAEAERFAINVEMGEKEIEQENAIADKKFELQKKETENKKKEAQIQKLIEKQKLADTSLILGQAAQLLDKQSAAYKILAVTQATIDTYRAANAALTAGPFIGEVLAALTIAEGLANVAKISSYAQGGYTGDGGKYDAAGTVHKGEFVMPQDIVNQYGKDHFQSYLDGSIAASNAHSGGSQANIEVNLGLKEFNEFNSRMKIKESISTQ
jgi:hypothetical protein